MKRLLILALAPVMKLWTWHVLRKCRCGVCGKIMTRKDAKSMLGRCGNCKVCGVVVRAITVVPPGDDKLFRQLVDTAVSNLCEFKGLPCPVCRNGEKSAYRDPVVPVGYNWQMVT